MAKVIAGTTARRMASSTTWVIRYSELRAPASNNARGERFQDILAEVVVQ
jgi:hypothetical protein